VRLKYCIWPLVHASPGSSAWPGVSAIFPGTWRHPRSCSIRRKLASIFCQSCPVSHAVP
jgi:hypothetical protein